LKGWAIVAASLWDGAKQILAWGEGTSSRRPSPITIERKLLVVVSIFARLQRFSVSTLKAVRSFSGFRPASTTNYQLPTINHSGALYTFGSIDNQPTLNKCVPTDSTI
jgi:hypothetical protein